MHYYILAKRQKFIAITADHHIYQYHIAQGYIFVTKVKAWNEKAALKAVSRHSGVINTISSTTQWLLLLVLMGFIIA